MNTIMTDKWLQDIGVEYEIAENTIDNRAPNLVNGTTIDEIYQSLQLYDECRLKKAASNTIIGNGNEDADIVFIGEAPGASEDKEGIPFCGRSGALLNNIIKAMGLTRESVYVTNSVFWRPPGNRRPTKIEISQCRPFLEQIIRIISPQSIILVGSTAVEALLNINSPMGSVRRKKLSYQSIDTYVIFHPSYLLRQPMKKKDMWEDIQFIKKYL